MFSRRKNRQTTRSMLPPQTPSGLTVRGATTSPGHRLLRQLIITALLSTGCLVCFPVAGNAEEPALGGALSFFADEQDLTILLRRLNADPEIAFVVPDGPPMMSRLSLLGLGLSDFSYCPWGSDGYWRRWRVMRPAQHLNDAEMHFLWHISAGPLATYPAQGEPQPIPDPWAGWTSEHPACVPNLTPAATIRLSLVTRWAAYSAAERASLHELNAYWLQGDLLVASDFQWSGASLQPGDGGKTARWMAQFQDWLRRNTVGLSDHTRTEVFWTFPSALQRLKSAIRYSARGYDLDESIRAAH
jgi:hypothetical protein